MNVVTLLTNMLLHNNKCYWKKFDDARINIEYKKSV